jgi:hypothetical protein
MHVSICNLWFSPIILICNWWTITVCLFAWWCLTPLSTIFQLYRGDLVMWHQYNVILENSDITKHQQNSDTWHYCCVIWFVQDFFVYFQTDAEKTTADKYKDTLTFLQYLDFNYLSFYSWFLIQGLTKKWCAWHPSQSLYLPFSSITVFNIMSSNTNINFPHCFVGQLNPLICIPFTLL